MKIETKLDIGFWCWILFKDKVHKVEVKSIAVEASGTYKEPSLVIKYWVKENPAGSQYTTCFYESEIFETKEELLATL